MRRLMVLLAAILPVARGGARAQGMSDTLPESVVSQAYEAFNRHDPAAFLAYFAPIWHYTALGDTAARPRRHTREQDLRDYLAGDAFRNKPTITVVRRLVVGPYVIDEQLRGRDSTRRLDIFEVRQGKILHEWESGPIPKSP
jgi:hypothetical protein